MKKDLKVRILYLINVPARDRQVMAWVLDGTPDIKPRLGKYRLASRTEVNEYHQAGLHGQHEANVAAYNEYAERVGLNEADEEETPKAETETPAEETPKAETETPAEETPAEETPKAETDADDVNVEFVPQEAKPVKRAAAKKRSSPAKKTAAKKIVTADEEE